MTVLLVLIWVTIIFLRPQEWLVASYDLGTMNPSMPPLVRPGYLTGFPLVEYVAIATLTVWLISLATGSKKLPPVPQNIIMAGLVGAMVLSYIVQSWLGGIYLSLRDFGKVALLFLILASVIDSEKKLKLSLALLVILVGVLAVQGINQYYTGLSFGGQTMVQERIRSTGILGDPNDLAMVLVMSVPFALSMIAGRDWPSPARVLGLAALPLVIVALYFTNSRGGIIALIAVLILYFRNKLGWKKGLALGAALVFLAIFFGSARMSETSLADTSITGRIAAWSDSLGMIKAHPLTGVGYAAFVDYSEQAAHNSFLLVGAELGLIGLFFWVALIYFTFKFILHWSKTPPSEMKSLTMDLGVSLAGFLVAAMFLSRAYNVVLYILLSLVIAAGTIGLRQGLIPRIRFTRGDFSKILAIEFVGVIFMYASVIAFKNL